MKRSNGVVFVSESDVSVFVVCENVWTDDQDV